MKNLCLALGHFGFEGLRLSRAEGKPLFRSLTLNSEINFKLTAFTALLFTALTVSASDPVPTDRLPYGGTWEGIVGVSGGIPNRTTVYTNFSPGASVAQINGAIAKCPSNQVVQLEAGTYSLAGNLSVAKNGVTVRGATDGNGNPATILVFSSGSEVVMNTTGWDYDNPGAYSNIGISSGHTRGSTSIVLASAPSGLTPGTLMWISAPRSAPTIDGNPSSYYANWFGSSDNHPFSEAFKVTGVSGSTVSFWPPLNSDYISGLACKVHFRSFANQMVLSGVESLVITNATGFFNCNIVSFSGCDQCWIKNCSLYGVGQNCQPNAGIKFYTSFNCEARHCRIQNAAAFGASEYAIDSTHSSGLLVEDNVFNTLPNVWPMIGTSRSAFAYNIFTNEPYQSANFLSQIVFHHGAHNHEMLFEGNWVPSHFNDLTASGNYSHSRNSLYFRQRMLGWDGNGPKDANCHCISFQTHHDNVTVAGCVMGHPGTQTQYQQTSGSVGGVNSIFNYDSTSGASLVRKGNYNTVNNGINSGEALASGDALIPSYLHSSKPTWFGNLPWPWCDPGNFNQANITTNLPAGYRFAFKAEPPGVGTANQAPIAKASASITSGQAPLAVAFSSTGSVDPEGTSLTYNWVFGDGGVSTAANPSHTYNAPGNYSAQLAVSDGTNTTASTAIAIKVLIPGTNQSPTAAASANPTSGVVPLSVNFSSAGSSDPDGTPLTYNWSFGDGGISTLANPSYTYQSTGTFSAVLTVSDGTNQTASSPIRISVVPVGSRPSGLVAALGFEEGSGSVVGDISGNGNSGTITGATWTNGYFGRALRFGPGALVTIADSPSLDLTTALTLEAWVNPDAISGTWMNLIFKPNGDPSTQNPAYVLQGASPFNSVPSFYISPATGNVLGASALPVNTWTHIAATYDGSTSRLFVNGVQVASQAQTGSIATTTDALTIGGNGFAGENWSGLIDEVRIYNQALTASQIQSDMTNSIVPLGPKPAAPTGLRVVSGP